MNYIYALSFDKGEEVLQSLHERVIKIDDNFFSLFESVILSQDEEEIKIYRKDTNHLYISNLSSKIQIEGLPIEETTLYKKILDRYTRSLKKNALTPFVENENFRRALLDYESELFSKYDIRLKNGNPPYYKPNQ